ncbi:MAG: hypothetical protein ACI85F_002010 [Bacteroidia bacterium]|jgi:hypothetical protein
MKRIFNTILIALAVVIGASSASYAQCDTIYSICSDHLSADFISDGQAYRALMSGDQIAEFSATFYGGSTYRIAACSGFTEGNLIFSIYDRDHNMLYSNSEYKNAPYWDFKFGNTIDCVIEAQLNSTNVKSGCAVLAIGFK